MRQAQLEFERLDSVRLEGLIEDDLLRNVQDELEKSEFAERVHTGIGTELCLKPGVVFGTLLLLANDPKLFQVVQQISGCSSIGGFEGRVYRFVPGSDHHDSWHSDVGHDRLIALSVNLGREPYEGGTFQLRLANTSDVLRELPNTRPGDGIMFRIDPRLRHRVTNVTGTVPKTAFAGWFRGTPSSGELFGPPFETLSLPR